MICQMCGNNSKTKSEIMKHYQKDDIIFFIPNRRYWDFKPLLEKTKPTSVDSPSDKPKAPIRNVGSQPFKHWQIIFFLNNLMCLETACMINVLIDQAQILPDATPPAGKIHPFSKIPITFKPIKQF